MRLSYHIIDSHSHYLQTCILKAESNHTCILKAESSLYFVLLVDSNPPLI